MTNRTATTRNLGDGYWGVWVDYNDREHAKALPGARWDAGLRCWRVPATFAADAQALCKRLNGATAGGAEAPAGLTAALVVVLRTAPARLRPITYKALARVWHPDAGGDLRLMQSLNSANDEVPQ